jgi:hypothetical protein
MATPLTGVLGTARSMLGARLWALAAFFFPTLAIVQDQSVVLAMLLFVMETMLASLVLAMRVGLSRRAASGEPAVVWRLREAWRVLLFFVWPFSLVCAVMLGAVTIIEIDKGRLQGSLAEFGDRARWMALTLLVAATLDTVLAPVRSVHWLETGVAWQGSRTAVLFLAVLLGWPIILFTGSGQGFFWTFFVLRLLSDFGGLKRGERERIRAQMFGAPLT